MNPITHFLVSWTVADRPFLEHRDRAIVTLSGIVPDLDGAGAVVEVLTRESARPLYWWTDFHHVVGHNLGAGLALTVIAMAAARKRLLTGLLVAVVFHLHLLCDLVGSRGPEGYDWPIPYLLPFSDRLLLSWSGQWALNAWPNIALTVVLLGFTFLSAWRRGYSPIGLISTRADRAFVATLRNRFGQPTPVPPEVA